MVTLQRGHLVRGLLAKAPDSEKARDAEAVYPPFAPQTPPLQADNSRGLLASSERWRLRCLVHTASRQRAAAERSTVLPQDHLVATMSETTSQLTQAHFANGKLSGEGPLKDGQHHGPWRFWHANRKPKAAGEYLNGQLEWWRENG